MNKLEFDKDELQLIVFTLGNEEYTVPMESVQEIIMFQKTIHIPKLPEFIEGVLNLRGNIVPIIDGRKRFEFEINKNSNETRIIVLELENQTMGLIVDAVSEVVHLKTSNIEPPPIEMGENNFILGIGKFKDRLLILLDPTNFLNESQLVQKALQAAKNTVKISGSTENQIAV